MMRKGAWAEKVEKVAKTLFDLTHCVSDIHDVGWPRWASEVDKRNYRSVAEWHVERIRAKHARSVRLVKRELRLMASHIRNDEQAGNEDGLAIHRYAASVLTDLLTALQRGRGGKG